MTEDSDNKRKKPGIFWYVFALIFVFLTIFSAIFISSRAYAAALPEIFMGTFNDVYTGSDDGVAQQPETGDVITTHRTVVILGSKWKLKPGFQLKSVASTDSRTVSVAKKKWKAVIKAKKAGTATITLTSVDGETKTYEIIVEDPQVKNLKIVVHPPASFGGRFSKPGVCDTIVPYFLKQRLQIYASNHNKGED